MTTATAIGLALGGLMFVGPLLFVAADRHWPSSRHDDSERYE